MKNIFKTLFPVKIPLLVMFFVSVHGSISGQNNLSSRIDSLIKSQKEITFNGIIIISKNGKLIYQGNYGFSDIDKKTPLKLNEQFVLGSISKQMTAALVLQELDKGRLRLSDPIKKYLSDLTTSWSDSVTIHHLLNHTSGIVDLNKPLLFKPGSQFMYSPVLTYQLLGRIIEKSSGQSYVDLAQGLFTKCNMNNTTIPVLYKEGALVSSYAKEENGALKKQNVSLENLVPWTPGAGIISTAGDLIAWNECLHGGKVLSKDSYRLMTSLSSQRKHPVWGEVGYGYGLQLDNKDNLLEIGHSGCFEGYNSIDFYYPASKTSIVVLSNVDWDPNDFEKTFFFQTQIRKIVKESELLGKK